MTTSDSRPVSGSASAAPPLEAWLKPIGVAALTSAVVSCLGAAIMIMSYYRYRWGTMPNTPTGPLTLRSYFGVRPFLYCTGWSLLYVLCYREWPALRRITGKIPGMVSAALLCGTAFWALIHFVISPSKLKWTDFELLFWLRYVLFIGPAIVWAVRRFSPMAPPRPIFARKPPAPASGWRQIVIGVVISVPALLCLIWLKTDPSAGYLMILAFFIGLGAVGVLAIAAGVILGGIWTMFGLPGRTLVSLSPIFLVVVGTLFVFFRPPV